MEDYISIPFADPEYFARWGPPLTHFLVDEGRIQIPLAAGHHRPTSEKPFKLRFACCADDGQTLNAGMVALWFSGDPDQYYLGTIYFCDFSGVGVRTPCPPFWIRPWTINMKPTSTSSLS